jgi:hypothetical protein
MFGQERLEKAMIYLAESDATFAEAHMDMERAEYRAKAIRNQVFLHCEGTVAERSAIADTSGEYDKAMGTYFESLREYDYLKNKRKTEELVIDVYRTLEASRRRA